MSADRESGQVAFSCDSKGCYEVLRTGTDDFQEAVDIAKEAGWKIRKISGEFMHFCPDDDCQP